MKGQWTGNYTGTSSGKMVVNVDERPTFYQGTAYLIDDQAALPPASATFRTKDKQNTFKFQTESMSPIDPRTGFLYEWDAIKQSFQGISFSKSADVEGSYTEDTLTLKWTTDAGVKGAGTLTKSKAADGPSELVPEVKDWNKFKAFVETLPPRKYLFRGQNEPWRLRTSFHRRGRVDLRRFLAEDIPYLLRHLSAKTKHFFNVNNPDENGAFVNMVRHHGYPTPLLDWTYSPYVAAFFAYHGIKKQNAASADGKSVVRIQIFDQDQWRMDYRGFSVLDLPSLHFSIIEFVAIENDRMIPQQAASTVTNIDDVESYIKAAESTNRKSYLTAIDLPARSRNDVMRELSVMGITAGSMFPGLDGACEELAERNFDI